jgi:DNA-binding NtrC family response regulator
MLASSRSLHETPIEILESRDDIAILLIDFNMPGSMDGLHLAAVVHYRRPPVAMMVVSGHTLIEQTSLQQRSRFFIKPYAPDQVIRALKSLLPGQAGTSVQGFLGCSGLTGTARSAINRAGCVAGIANC